MGVVIFLVVTVSPNHPPAITYLTLSPFKIDGLLRNAAENKKTVSLELKDFPEASDEIVQIVRFALDSNDENLNAGFDPLIFENAGRFLIRSREPIDFQAEPTFNTAIHDVLVSVETRGGARFPLNGEFKFFKPLNEQVRALNVSSGEVEFCDAPVFQIGEMSSTIELTSSLSLSIRTVNGETQLHLQLASSPAGNLVDRMKCIDFLFAVQRTGTITIGDHTAAIHQIDWAQLSPLEEELGLLRRIGDLSSALNFSPELVDLQGPVNPLALERAWNSLINGVEFIESNLAPGPVELSFGEMKILLLLLPGTEPDAWKLVDGISSPKARSSFIQNSDQPEDIQLLVTPYELIDADDLANVLNLDLSTAVEAYSQLPAHSNPVGLAANMVVRLLHAADLHPNRRSEFLEGATALAKWTVQEDPDSPLHLINMWQAHARMSSFTDEMLDDIRALKNRPGLKREDIEAEVVSLACALLLRESDEARYWRSRVGTERLEQFDSWPISRLSDEHFWHFVDIGRGVE